MSTPYSRAELETMLKREVARRREAEETMAGLWEKFKAVGAPAPARSEEARLRALLEGILGDKSAYFWHEQIRAALASPEEKETP